MCICANAVRVSGTPTEQSFVTRLHLVVVVPLFDLEDVRKVFYVES